MNCAPLRSSPLIHRTVVRLDAILAMRRVSQVEPRDGFTVWLRFDDDVEGELDLSDLAGGGVFTAWTDRDFFESVSLGPDRGITWRGDLDLCADRLYLDLTGKPLRDAEVSGAGTPA